MLLAIDCFIVYLDTPTPSLAVDSSDSTSGPSPRVLSARQRKMSHGYSEGNTPKTPKSALVAGSSKTSDDRVFFGSNFSVEHVGDLATMTRPTLGLCQLNLMKLYTSRKLDCYKVVILTGP